MTVARDSHHENSWALSPTKITTRRVRAARESRRHYPWGPLSPLLRDGVRPLFVAGDAAACLITAVIVNAGGQSMIGVTFVMVSLLAIGGLNRSRLSLSAPRRPATDHPSVAGRRRPHGRRVGSATGYMQLVAAVRGVAGHHRRADLLYGVVRSWRTRGSVTHPTVVVGSGALGQLVVDAMANHPESGLRAVGFVDSRTHDAEELAVPMLGEPSELHNRARPDSGPRADRGPRWSE